MTKREAIELFGGRVKDLAAALGVTPSAVSQMPEVLPPRLENEIIGAAVKHRRVKIVVGTIEVLA